MTLTRILMITLTLFLSFEGLSQNKPRSPEQIRNEMTEIEENTDWSDEAASAKAQAKMEELSKELMMAGKAQQLQGQGIRPDSASLEEEAEYKMGLWKQMLAAVDQGESGDILLAKPLREKIVEAYRNDESPKIKNPHYFEEQTFLCIDMSVPTIQRIIEQMENFKSIKVLLITCSQGPVPVNLEDIISRAKTYPLEQLHIINFKQYVATVPAVTGKFKNLKILSLYNNSIATLPSSLSNLTSLQKLYIDMNPVSTLLPMISSLQELEILGVAKTNISSSETEHIRTALPHCNILTQ